jgi:hypothetical protein
LDDNLAHIREELDRACREAGRSPEEVTLLAAIKSADVGQINYLHRVLGVCDVGENRVQQLLARYDQLDREGLRIHFIGTLQSNKVKYIIDKVDMIQSLDSLGLAGEIEKQCAKRNLNMDVLIEINAGHEESKSGVAPEEARALAAAVCSGDFPHLHLRGFMTMAPRGDQDAYRRIFASIRTLCRSIWEDTLGRDSPMVLSMGMSESYVPAAMEGSTLVRVGRGLFAKPEGAALPAEEASQV